jgi:hypothetical protein
MSVQPAPVQPTARLVLEGVPRIHFYEGGPRCPEDVCLPSVMRAYLEYLGDADFGCKHCLASNPTCKVFCSYSFFMGVTGAAAFLSWKKGWHGDNVAIFYLSADPAAPERRAFASVGYAFDWLEKSPAEDNETLFRLRIFESLQKGRPVIGYGVIGPPEPCLVTGFDDGGDVLIGWSFFQQFPDFNAGVEFEPSGCFRKRDWYKDTSCLLFVGEKGERPPLTESYREALKWLLQVARTSQVRPEPTAPAWYQERANGLAAYTAWAEHLLDDEAFPAADEGTLRQHHTVHNDAVGNLAEVRWYGSQFLIEAINFLPYQMAEDLLHAAALYAGEHELMWKVWDLAGGNGNPQAYTFMPDPAIRRQMADLVLQARQKDAEAANYIEQALSKDTGK